MSTDEDTTLRFAKGSANIDALQLAVNEAVAAERAAGDVDLPEQITVEEESQGFDPITIAVAVTLIKFGGHVATQVWDDHIWPRVRTKLGDDAVGKRKDDD